MSATPADLESSVHAHEHRGLSVSKGTLSRILCMNADSDTKFQRSDDLQYVTQGASIGPSSRNRRTGFRRPRQIPVLKAFLRGCTMSFRSSRANPIEHCTLNKGKQQFSPIDFHEIGIRSHTLKAQIRVRQIFLRTHSSDVQFVRTPAMSN